MEVVIIGDISKEIILNVDYLDYWQNEILVFPALNRQVGDSVLVVYIFHLTKKKIM